MSLGELRRNRQRAVRIKRKDDVNEIDIMYPYQEPPLQMEHKPNLKTIELSPCGNIIMVSFGVCYEHRSISSLGIKERSKQDDSNIQG